MPASRVDVVIFGATGFTGKKAVEEVARTSKQYNFTWAVAGRSKNKLDLVMAEVSKKTGKDLSSIKRIIADVDDQNSLRDMCEQARVVANCCGPYTLYGEPVVKAAIDSSTHYVDVSGEPQFMEKMYLKYHEAAKLAGVYVVSACAVDCIPNDMGVVFMQQNFDGILHSVETYMSIKQPSEDGKAKSAHLHQGTWASVIYCMAYAGELISLQRKMNSKPLPVTSPKLTLWPLHKKDGGWCVPFVGSDDRVVSRTQRFLYESEGIKPVQFLPYMKFKSLLVTLMLALGAVMIFFLSQFKWTRQLLLDYPHVFTLGLMSKEGPSEEVMDNTKFKLTMYGRGWEKGADVDTPPNKRMVAQVSGVNPAYGATTTCLIFSAVTILKDQNKMPPSGGVLTTGAAFYNTELIKRLNDNNVKFEIVQS